MQKLLTLSSVISAFSLATATSPSLTTPTFITHSSVLSQHSLFNDQQHIISQQGQSTTKHPSHHHIHTVLFSKKNKKKAGSGKIQVRLTKQVPGTGNVGDIIMVSPAFFDNKLRRTGSAERITDEEVKALEKERAEKKEQAVGAALEMKEKVEGLKLVMPRNAGPSGHLFGGIGNKVIVEELRRRFPKNALVGKKVKILSVKDGDGKVLGHDIKDLGEYSVVLSLKEGVTAGFTVSVERQKKSS